MGGDAAVLPPGRRERRRTRRRVWTAVGAGLSLGFVATIWLLSALAMNVVAPFIRSHVAPLIREATRLQAHPVRQSDVPRILPGVPLFPGARLDPNMTLLYRLMEPVNQPPSASRSLGQVAFTTPAPPGEVVDWYEGRMAGWSMDDFNSSHWDHSRVLKFSRPGERLEVRVSPGRNAFGPPVASLLLRLVRQAPPPRLRPWPPSPWPSHLPQSSAGAGTQNPPPASRASASSPRILAETGRRRRPSSVLPPPPGLRASVALSASPCGLSLRSVGA